MWNLIDPRRLIFFICGSVFFLLLSFSPYVFIVKFSWLFKKKKICFFAFLAICPVGSEPTLISETPCQKCDFGSYKNDIYTPECAKCPSAKHVTRGMGSIEASQCEGNDLQVGVKLKWKNWK